MQILNDQKAKLKQPIFLVGPMGSGKSTLGLKLSLSLNVKFIDVDEEIVKKSGKKIPLIFKEQGESGFRDIESQVLQEILENNHNLCVISGGGGIILRAENRQKIIENTTCVYLYCPVDTQFLRVAGDQNRPMIAQDKDQKQKLSEIFNLRDPLFRQMCHICVDTSAHDLNSCIAYLESSLY